jgi:hypothetical protein
MPESEEPRIHTSRNSIPHGGNLTITFKGEQYKGLPILDTRVEIEGGCLFCLTWEEKEQFMDEFRALIDKYAI